ncbi:MAG: hypothetical protein U0325_24075 [Polyangiales bacterium]
MEQRAQGDRGFARGAEGGSQVGHGAGPVERAAVAEHREGHGREALVTENITARVSRVRGVRAARSACPAQRSTTQTPR